MKRGFGVILLLLVVLLQAFSYSVVGDKEDLETLTDGFAVAMAKKDKVWMAAYFTDDCITYAPGGQTLNKQSAINAFTGGVYVIEKSVADNKSFMIAGKDAGGSVDYRVQGTMADGNDISGTYKLTFKFNRTTAGWRISEILVNGE